MVLLGIARSPEFVEIAWAAQRSGLYYTAINWHLQSGEIAYILGHCGAKVLIVDTTDEQWRATVSLTLDSVFYATRAALRSSSAL